MLTELALVSRTYSRSMTPRISEAVGHVLGLVCKGQQIGTVIRTFLASCPFPLSLSSYARAVVSCHAILLSPSRSSSPSSKRDITLMTATRIPNYC